MNLAETEIQVIKELVSEIFVTNEAGIYYKELLKQTNGNVEKAKRLIEKEYMIDGIKRAREAKKRDIVIKNLLVNKLIKEIMTMQDIQEKCKVKDLN